MGIQPIGKGISNIASRAIFSPLFKSRWQNFQNIINDSEFMNGAPEPYLTYYNAYIKQWLQWSTGFVPMLHRGDFFSTGMGYTVCDIFTKECMSGGFRIDSINEDLKQFFEVEWREQGNDLENVLNEMFFFSNAGGNAILSLTPNNKDLHINAIPVNRIYFQIGRGNKISEATIFNRLNGGGKSYVAVESRIKLDNKYYYIVELVNSGIVLSPNLKGQKLPKIPDNLKNAFSYAYGNIEINCWYEMPEALNSIGLYNVRNKSVAVAIADIPGYSDSTLHTALDVLYSIDFNFTQSQIDQYMGKSRCLIPKEMQPVNIKALGTGGRNIIGDGLLYENAIKSAPLEEEFYTQIASTNMNGEPIKPQFVQPDLRGEVHKIIRDADLELLASKVGLSSTTLANHLAYNTSKTATEVRSEQDTTEKSVNNKRRLASKEINAALCDIARFYGFESCAEIVWGRAGANSATENQELLSEYQAGTMPLKQYLKRRHGDLSEQDIDKWVADLEAQNKQQAFGEMQYNDMNYFGGNDDEERIVQRE